MTAEEVKVLCVGETVFMRKEGCESVLCIVAYHGSVDSKFLTYRINGRLKKCAIRDYPGVQYSRKGG